MIKSHKVFAASAVFLSSALAASIFFGRRECITCTLTLVASIRSASKVGELVTC